MLQADPTLTPAQVRNRLYAAARADVWTGAVPNVSWGRGRLDIFAALLSHLPQSSVSGVITDAQSGAGVAAEAVLRLDTPGYNHFRIETQSDAAGAFMAQLPLGDYTVEVSPPVPLVPLQRNITVENQPVTVDFALQVAQVVLVNDDPAGDFASYYTTALDSLNLIYAVHTASTQGPLLVDRVAALQALPVIWFTGNAAGEVLSAADKTFLSLFLDGGGSLFLSGQNIAESLANDAFLSQRLHVGFVQNINDARLHGVAGDAVGDGLITIITSGALGANNQSSRDVLAPEAMVSACAVYDTTSNIVAGVRVANPSNNSRLVFFGFGFEAITVTAFPRPENARREQVLARVLNWLGESVSVAGRPHSTADLPTQFQLHPIYPNPLRRAAAGTAEIRYALPVDATATRIALKVFDVLGREVATLADEAYKPGNFTARWNGRDQRNQHVVSGVYFCRLQAGTLQQVRKVLVVR